MSNQVHFKLTFWNEIGFIFQEAYKDIYNQSEMSPSQKGSEMQLVYKSIDLILAQTAESSKLPNE